MDIEETAVNSEAREQRHNSNENVNGVGGRSGTNSVPQQLEFLVQHGDCTVLPHEREPGKCRKAFELLQMAYVQFWVAATYGLLAPYLPRLAASRGLEAWKYGFVFSIGKITTLIGSILGQPFVRFTSPRTVFLFGQAGYFAANVLYGLLYWTTDENSLLGFGLLFGVLGGFTESVYAVISYSVVSLIFYDNPGVAIAAMQFLWGTGGGIGAIIGGLLIDLWAYPLPFFVVPSLFIIPLPLIATSSVFQRLRKFSSVTDLSHSEETAVHRHLLGDVVFAICLINMMFNGSIFGFNEATLEPYLQNFLESSSGVGSVFTTQMMSFSVGSILAGVICVFKVEACFIPIAHTGNILTYLLLGPAPFLPFEPNLYLIYVSQVLVGAGMAMMCVLSYCHALKRAVKKGYHDNIQTHTFLSSAMFSSYVVGAMISPPISGYLVETFGYKKGSMALLGILLAWTPATVIPRWKESEKPRPRDAEWHILRRESNSPTTVAS